MPFAIIGSTMEVTKSDGKRVLGRKYPWGVCEVENEQHCDFKKLRSLLVRTHMHDLITTTEDIHFENYRINRLKNRGEYLDSTAINRYVNLYFKDE